MLKETELTDEQCWNYLISLNVSKFQSFIVESLALAKIFPSLLKQTEFIYFWTLFNVTISSNVYIFHNLIVLSEDALAKIVASILNATDLTESWCPRNTPIFV